MKRIICFFAGLFAVVCLLTSCDSPNDKEKDINRKVFSAQFLVYENTDEIKAKVVDISDTQIRLSESAIYSYPQDNYSLSNVTPVYFDGTQLVLTKEPSMVSITTKHISDDNELFFGKYSLTTRDDIWAICFENEILFKVDSVYSEVGHTPVSFYACDEKYYVLCMTKESLPESDVVCIRLSNNGDIDQYIVYDGWESVGITKAMMNKYNTFNGAKGFVYNEGKKLIYLDPTKNEIKELLKESDVEADIPSLDTYREFHNFFSDCVLMTDCYAVSFSSFNSLPGTYILYYSYDNTLLAYVLVEEQTITLFKEGIIADKIEGKFLHVATIVN